MANLIRYTQKLFGSTAGTNQIAEFGSFAAGTPLRFDGATITPTIIQALSNYLSGWNSAVVGNNSPLQEDMNALCYLFAYQLAYLLQKGVPEWDIGTTYYIGSLAMSGGYVYISLTNSNTGNAVTDTANWAQAPQNGMVTPDTMPGDTLTQINKTLTWPYLIIPVATTMNVVASSHLVVVDVVTVNGTLLINGTMKVI